MVATHGGITHGGIRLDFFLSQKFRFHQKSPASPAAPLQQPRGAADIGQGDPTSAHISLEHPAAPEALCQLFDVGSRGVAKPHVAAAPQALGMRQGVLRPLTATSAPFVAFGAGRRQEAQALGWVADHK